jgi:hypothetical protein
MHFYRFQRTKTIDHNTYKKGPAACRTFFEAGPGGRGRDA